jgi:hypothetical protein
MTSKAMIFPKILLAINPRNILLCCPTSARLINIGEKQLSYMFTEEVSYEPNTSILERKLCITFNI